MSSSAPLSSWNKCRNCIQSSLPALSVPQRNVTSSASPACARSVMDAACRTKPLANLPGVSFCPALATGLRQHHFVQDDVGFTKKLVIAVPDGQGAYCNIALRISQKERVNQKRAIHGKYQREGPSSTMFWLRVELTGFRAAIFEHLSGRIPTHLGRRQRSTASLSWSRSWIGEYQKHRSPARLRGMQQTGAPLMMSPAVREVDEQPASQGQRMVVDVGENAPGIQQFLPPKVNACRSIPASRSSAPSSHVTSGRRTSGRRAAMTHVRNDVFPEYPSYEAVFVALSLSDTYPATPAMATRMPSVSRVSSRDTITLMELLRRILSTTSAPRPHTPKPPSSRDRNRRRLPSLLRKIMDRVAAATNRPDGMDRMSRVRELEQTSG